MTPWYVMGNDDHLAWKAFTPWHEHVPMSKPRRRSTDAWWWRLIVWLFVLNGVLACLLFLLEMLGHLIKWLR